MSSTERSVSWACVQTHYFGSIALITSHTHTHTHTLTHTSTQHTKHNTHTNTHTHTHTHTHRHTHTHTLTHTHTHTHTAISECLPVKTHDRCCGRTRVQPAEEAPEKEREATLYGHQMRRRQRDRVCGGVCA